MGRFVEGEDRQQVSLMPECLDDYIAEDNPVRVIDAFVGELDLVELGFEGAMPATTGRPAYHPATLLKVYIYGYLNRIQSSRRLERECRRNVELMWLTGRLSPDFKTIADFRRDNGKGIRNVCRRFVVLCRDLKLLSQAMVAIDSSKFKETADRTQPAELEAKSERLQDKIKTLREQMRRMECIKDRLAREPEAQLSLTDRDARSMMSQAKGTGMVGYNVQTAVDATHHLIVAHEVTNVGSDRAQLSKMALAAREAMDKARLHVVADRGYYNSPELKACDDAGIATYVPRPMTSNAKAEGRFNKADFIYIARDDEYECPAGQRAIYRFTREENGLQIRRY